MEELMVENSSALLEATDQSGFSKTLTDAEVSLVGGGALALAVADGRIDGVNRMKNNTKNDLVLSCIIFLSFLLGVRNSDQTGIVLLSAVCILGGLGLMIYGHQTSPSTRVNDDVQS